MNGLIFVFFVILFLFEPSGFCADEGEMPAVSDPIEEGPIDDLEMGDEEELRLSSREVREISTYGLGIGLGVTEAWQSISMCGFFLETDDLHYQICAGGSPWHLSGDKGGNDYEIDLISRAFGGGFRFFFMNNIPFFYGAGLGFSFLSGDIQPIGADGEVDENQEEATNSLDTGFSIQGLWISHQLGWQVAWGSGFFLEGSLFGLAKTFVIQETYTHGSAQAKAAIKEQVETPMTWGLANIKLGYLF